jgi:hypothetical protein
MGNCLVIKIMRVDGSKVSSPPLKVEKEVEPHPGISVLPARAPVVDDPGAPAVRVKLVISKQELKRMLDKEGMSLDDMVSAMHKVAVIDRECCGGWRPALESIPEGTGFWSIAAIYQCMISILQKINFGISLSIIYTPVAANIYMWIYIFR